MVRYARMVLAAAGLWCASLQSYAAATGSMPFSFKNKEITEIVESYARFSGRAFMVDPSTRGKITVYAPAPVSADGAFELLSEALAINGFSILEKEGLYVVTPARQAQRNLLPVSTELPALKPERMVTWVYKTKHLSANEINNSLRILASKDGEIISDGKNKIVFTDWVSNLHRMQKILAQLDVK